MSSRRPTVCLVMPAFYGIRFVDALAALDAQIVVVAQRDDDPLTYGYDAIPHDLLVADIYNADSIVQALASRHLDALVPATDYVIHSTSIAAESLGLFSAGVLATRRARMKHEARALYNSSDGLRPISYAAVSSCDTAIKEAASIGYPVVGKPVDCACSQNVRVLYCPEDVEAWWRSATAEPRSYLNYETSRIFLIEQFISDTEYSVEAFLNDGEPLFTSVTEKIMGPPPNFVELGHVVPARISTEQQRQCIEAARTAIRSLGFRDGPFHVELRVTPTGVVIMEVNARPAGDRIATDLLPLAFGADFFTATLQLYLRTQPVITLSAPAAAAIVFEIVGQSGKVATCSTERGNCAVAVGSSAEEALDLAQRQLQMRAIERSNY